MSSLEIANVGESATQASRHSTWGDWLGIVASIACAIHCAAMPFVIAYLPMLGLSFLADEAFHKWMALICFLIAICAFVPGLRKHRSWVPVGIGAIGLGIITFAAFGLEGECCSACAEESQNTTAVANESGCDDCEECAQCKATDPSENEVVAAGASLDAETESQLFAGLVPWVTPFGGLLLVSAHLLNRRYGYACGCCQA